jgi:Bacterial Ig-like domain
LRKIAAQALAVAVRRFATVTFRPRRAALLPVASAAGAVALVVAGLLVGLPARPVAGQTIPTFAALAPQANAQRAGSGLPLDVPFEVQFTKPMSEGTVASALTVTPAIDFRLEWDATGQVLSVAPIPFWQPYTQYTVDITSAATDAEGLSLATPVHESFQSGSPTAGQISATRMVGGRASPSTAFQLTFTRPVKLATVLLRLGISPQVDFSIVGDDPTDAASRVFTLTPRKPLATNMTYLVSMSDGGTDAAGAPLRPVEPFEVITLQAPAATFTPQNGSITYDTNQLIAIKFSVPMDEKSATAALAVQENGRTISGSTYWSDDAMTLTFNARYSFYVGAHISVRVGTSARSADGLNLAAVAADDFTVSTPRARVIVYTSHPITWTGGIASSTAPYHGSELYYLSLMNCTRTGGWVTSAGDCSSQTHHTLPARSALSFSTGIANNVSRPYAKALADRNVLTHTLDGTTAHSRLCAAGYCGYSWGENIASPSNAGQGGMISVEIYFQNEYYCRCAHYYNIMDPYFSTAGVGIWVTGGAVRVVIDFYG